MVRKNRLKWKHVVKFGLLALVFFVSGALRAADDKSWDGEKLALEITMQQRVESALSKILPPGQFVVVVRIDAVSGKKPWKKEESGPDFFLPGVPVRSKLDDNKDIMKDIANSLQPDPTFYQRFVRRVSALLVIDQDIPEETVEKVRELSRQMLALDAERGDTLEIQRTIFNKPKTPLLDQSNISRLQRGLKSYWLIISLALILFCLSVFILFVFGPLRGFLNRFVSTLSTLKPAESGAGRANRLGGMDSQVLPAMMAQAMGMLPRNIGGGGNQGGLSGSLMVENPNKKLTPFGFIREDHLSNLAVLLSRENPEKAAVVLGYLPPEWISRVLSKMEPDLQSAVTDHLATTRQLLPEQVEDIEQDLKRRLDYLIGGPDRIIAVYESLEPEAQKKMLESIKAARPELAEELRQRTFLFEDLDKLEPKALKSVLREVDMQTMVLAMRGQSEAFRKVLLDNLSPGKAEIVLEELEFSDGPPGRAGYDAQRKISLLVRRLEREGRIELPKIEEGATQGTRFGGSLKSSLKLPQGFNPDDAKTPEVVTPTSNEQDIQTRIRSFMNRTVDDSERFPYDEESEPPKEDSA